MVTIQKNDPRLMFLSDASKATVPTRKKAQAAAATGQPSASHLRLLGTARKEAIDAINDPARFGVVLETSLDKLAKTGKAKERPWADTYWPTYQDGLNHRWQSTGNFKNDLSPAEKFDAAFNNWNPDDVKGLKPFAAEYGQFDKPFDASYYDKLGPLAKYLSSFKGNKATRDAAAAGKLNSDGTAKSGKEEEDFGGVESWTGLCHAWCPASIREKEPLHAVEHNGVRFEVSDIKALLIACYNRSNSIMIGGRDEQKSLEVDTIGRPKSAGARDINPGTMHILLGTLLGRDGQPFVEDRTASRQVWNQPIAEYRVVQQDEVSAADAAKLLGKADGKYDFNAKAVKFVHVKTEVDYISESYPSTNPNSGTDAQEREDPYEYILELDQAGKIIGGEWVGDSRTAHPDFLWYPYKDGGMPIAPQISLEQVRVLLAKSREPIDGTGGGGTTTNPDLVNVEKTAKLDKGQTFSLEPIVVKKSGVLELSISGSGDMDVYARKGKAPTFNAQDGSPIKTSVTLYEPGSNEKKTLNVKAGDKIYVTMRGYEDSNAKLTIKQLS